MSTAITKTQVRDVDDDSHRRCPRCSRALQLDHETLLAGVIHAGCTPCHLHYQWTEGPWMQFGGCQACRPN